jgi:hypothetical protein
MAALRPERAGSARAPAAAPAIAAMLLAITRPASEVYKPRATNTRTINATVAVIVPTIRPSTSESYRSQRSLRPIEICPSDQNTRIRRQCPLTDKINSSPIAVTARFSSVITCLPFRSVASSSRLADVDSPAGAAAVSRDATNPYSATLPRTDRHGEVVRERYSAECVKGSYSLNTNSLGSAGLAPDQPSRATTALGPSRAGRAFPPTSRTAATYRAWRSSDTNRKSSRPRPRS